MRHASARAASRGLSANQVQSAALTWQSHGNHLSARAASRGPSASQTGAVAGAVAGADAGADAGDVAGADVGGVRFAVADLAATGVADSSVDVVISNGAFCLAPDKPAAFREVRRLLLIPADCC